MPALRIYQSGTKRKYVKKAGRDAAGRLSKTFLGTRKLYPATLARQLEFGIPEFSQQSIRR